MYATVVVDIPDLKHQGFDYFIPDSFRSTLQVGSRVLVPLAGRMAQGYVVDLHETTEIANVKPIHEVLDIIPVLSQEMIQLGKWMSEHYVSQLFRTYQILLPSALKTQIEEYIILGNEDFAGLSMIEMEIIDWVKPRQPIHRMKLIERFPSEEKTIKKLIQSGFLELQREFKDKTKNKKKTYVQSRLPKEQLLLEMAALPKQATKQKMVLDFFITHETEEVGLLELLSVLKITRNTVQSLVKKGYLLIKEKEEYRDPYKDRLFQDKKIMLTPMQEQVLSQIIQSLEKERSVPFLLHGVTGSGKTEIYLNAIQHTLNLGKDSILLVPEISLTPQMVERFKGRFGELVAVMHSRMSQGERYDEWRRIQKGKAKIVVGARSAIFAPFQKLGLIIIDEEHESSYKQEEHPKYHARDIAIWRANYHHATLVLGSATPSLESYYQVLTKNYQLLELPKRVLGRELPMIHIVDMREQLRKGNRSMFSQMLQEKIVERLEKKEQIVLFLNRRGYSTFVMCRSCGYVMKCPHCDISLTYHHSDQSLRCHYCGYTTQQVKRCPECHSPYIRYFGTGTQKVEEELTKRFPGVRVIRMDVDTTSKKGAHERLLNAFKNEQADILLGTQMIAKGLDFPKVTLVGVLAADSLLRIPNFRSAERTFQLLTQVSGRAGRHELPGDVIIQTYDPDHYSIRYAGLNDYNSFFRRELEKRRQLHYPPFTKMIIIHFSHEDVVLAMKAIERFARELKRIMNHRPVEILGPAVAPIPKIKDRYRFQCVIKYNDESSRVNQGIYQGIQIINEIIKDRKLLIQVDVDPYMLL
ncbi:primosomal protein N' [Tepidibacillus sp. LV47]|uniref:primosomal protein N' n=1 Tax=Tepidibacillus sp. LV47 TaxID=3398228 RepID=UPI003AAD2EC3